MGKTLYHAAAMMLLVALCGGCSMCQQCELNSYSAEGGRWQRTDRDHGRVGSLFAPAGGLVPYDAAADPHAVPDDESAAPELRPPGESGEDDAPDAEAPQANGDSVLQGEEDREAQEARERRLRELELEDIRFQQ